jgi:hypothetical protein
MADPDFDRIFAATGAKDTITDVVYDEGWEPIALANPPTKAQFNSLQNESDLKSKYLYDRLAARDNLLINGDKLINQRGFAGGQPAAGVYGFDRWKGDALSTRIEQVVENTETLSGLYTISWVGGTGTADVDGTTGLSSGDSVTMTATGNYSVIVPTDATKIKFEQGSVATPYQPRPIAEEKALCQRYYQVKNTYFTFRVEANVTLRWTTDFMTQMRTAPSTTLNMVNDAGGATSVGNVREDAVELQFTTGGSGTFTKRGTATLDSEL